METLASEAPKFVCRYPGFPCSRCAPSASTHFRAKFWIKVSAFRCVGSETSFRLMRNCSNDHLQIITNYFQVFDVLVCGVGVQNEGQPGAVDWHWIPTLLERNGCGYDHTLQQRAHSGQVDGGHLVPDFSLPGCTPLKTLQETGNNRFCLGISQILTALLLICRSLSAATCLTPTTDSWTRWSSAWSKKSQQTLMPFEVLTKYIILPLTPKPPWKEHSTHRLIDQHSSCGMIDDGLVN